MGSPNGTTNPTLRPVPVTGITTAVAVAAGYRHSCALLQDGRVQCWGDNTFGELGDGAFVPAGKTRGADLTQQVPAYEIGVDLALPNALAAGDEMARLGLWRGTRPDAPQVSARKTSPPGKGQAVLASWRMLLDAGRLQDGEPYLAGTAHPPVARLSTATAGEIGAAEGDLVSVSTDRGEITLPLAITEMPDRVVWLPLNSAGSSVHQQLAVTAGAVVSIGRAVQ